MNKIDRIERTLMKPDVPNIIIGATVRVHLRIIDGEKERIQVYEGIVIGKKGTKHRSMITVRKVSHGVGVERVFPLHSPLIQKIETVQEGDVRRAKLYYLRERTGRAARVAERKRTPVPRPSLAATPKASVAPSPAQDGLVGSPSGPSPSQVASVEPAIGENTAAESNVTPSS